MRQSDIVLQQIKARKQLFVGKRNRLKPRKPRFPMAIEREYKRFLRSYVLEYIALVKSVLISRLPYLVGQASIMMRPDRSDNWATDLAELLNAITFQFNQNTADRVKVAVETIASRVSNYNKEDVYSVIRSVIGVDVFTTEPWLAARLESFKSFNRHIIKDLGARATMNIERIAQQGLADGSTAKQIGKEIEQQFGIATRRAELIARNEVATLNGGLTQLRQTNLGITKYIWSTSLDERVRPEHAAREGEVFEWTNPPEDGPPGIPINCRCVAIPILDDLLEQV